MLNVPQVEPSSNNDIPLILWVNWIYAIVTFTSWKNAITKTKLRDMPLQLLYTSICAIVIITKAYTANYTQIVYMYSAYG
jgi:hypothetical protein